MAHVLRLDADFDLITKYGRAFRHEMIFADFERRWPNHTIATLEGSQFVQPAVNEYLRENKVDYVTACGHGPKSFNGFNNGLIWKPDQAGQFLRNKLAHFLTCQDKGRLTRAALDGGARACWGYSKAFKFHYKEPGLADPVQDEVARIYFKMDCLIDEGILSSKSPMQIYSEITAYFEETYEQLEDRDYLRNFLLDNYEGLIYFPKTRTNLVL